MKNKNTWAIIGLTAIVVLLLCWILQPDKQHDSHAADNAEAKADNDTLKAHGLVYRHVNDSLIKDNHRLDSANKSLLRGQAATEGKLNAKSAEVRTLLSQIKEINQDTGYFGHLLDSLEEQVKSLSFLIVQYEQYADSINNVNDSLTIGYEAMIKEKDKRISELQAGYDKLYIEYIVFYKTTKELQKDLRRQKLKTKIAAVLGGALAIITLLK